MFYAIIGDIRNSKKTKNRFQIQEQLEEILKEINREYDNCIAANFIITLGDEFQGLLNSTKPLINIIEKIKIKMYPTEIRFGIGFGEISTKINKEMAISADGPAYYCARKMINEIKKSEKSRMSDKVTIKLCSDEKGTIVELINNTFCLWSFIQDKWTPKQTRLIFEDIISGNNQREVAQKLGIVQSTVQRGLKSSGYYSYLHTKRILEEVLLKEWG
ncbi:MAG TPA: SatD family protein [Ruminiclostridium sp.]